MEALVKKVRAASLTLATLTTEQKNEALSIYAQVLEEYKEDLLKENSRDLEEQKDKISPSLYQRLALSSAKIDQLIQGIEELIQLPDPVGQCTLERELSEGLVLERVTTPIGVIGVIFESRPDAAIQISSLLLKSGNAGLLKGGKEAHNSNHAIYNILKEVTKRCDFLPDDVIVFLESRQDVMEMLSYHEDINLVIPRGSNELVKTIMNATKIPVIGHADGVCHIYVDKDCNLDKAIEIIVNAKTQYPAACNAVETLLIHDELYEQTKQILSTDFPQIELVEKPESWSIEYGDNRLSIKSVTDTKEAIVHINRFGSHHTDAIITNDPGLASHFQKKVDSSGVYVNCSTRFADGFQYGFGAEVGISTHKTHARGPVGLEGLVIYKYLLSGQGHIRPN